MRFPRTSLLNRMAGPDAPSFVLLEAPTGFGKSWLLRNAAPAGALRLRGELGPLDDPSSLTDQAVVIDDAHLLSAEQIGHLVECIEDAPRDRRLMVAGRILPDVVHDVARLVDGLILDSTALALGIREIIEEVPEDAVAMVSQLVSASDGWVKVISTALEQQRLDPGSDPVAVAFRSIRAAASAALQQLDRNDVGLVGMLARAPGIDQSLLRQLGGSGFIDRALAAGVPLRRQLTGGIDLVAESAFRGADVEPAVAARVAGALAKGDRPIEAIELLLDAHASESAVRRLVELPDSITRTVEPRSMLALLARLGTLTEREPMLLLMRAAALSVIGQLDRAGADIERAADLATTVDPSTRRRVMVEAAEWKMLQGHADDAVATAEQAIKELGPGEDRTYARAHVVLANVASLSNSRANLQKAAELYRVAAATWERCGEAAQARLCRNDLATAVLVLLGRYDEALAQLAAILGVAELTDAERSWMILNEGFVLCNANRLDAAEARFVRVAELGYVQDNPRIIAAAAWGRAMVAFRRADLPATLRWIGTAENTALGVDDDVLGVPFLCDVTTALGAFGEIGLAERYLARAQERRALFEDEIGMTEFVLLARRGVLGDVDAQLLSTPPSEWWRVQLVSAYAAAAGGDLGSAQNLLADAERELVTLGFSDFDSLGERRTYESLMALLSTAPTAIEAGSGPIRIVAPAGTSVPPPAAAGRRLRVIGAQMRSEAGGEVLEIPPGNLQRLVGVVVAYGGMASFDQISEAIWPGDDVEASRARLRNVLLRLRRVVGDVLVRSGTGVRLAPDMGCDLYDFERAAGDALATVRNDPDVAGQLATQALRMAEGSAFADFEYEEWAMAARRSMEHKLLGLLDLLSVQAQDDGDLVLAQALAERALRYDRYSDSRYVRLAEILAMQGRPAAAVAVLEDAGEVAKELSGTVSSEVKQRRDAIMRQQAAGN